MSLKSLLVQATVANALLLENRGIEPERAGVGRLLFKMCLVRAVDSALAYMSAVLELIYHQYPGALRSKERVDVDYVLQFNSAEDLLHALIERKVHGLSFRSLTDLDEYVSQNLGLSLFANKEQRARAVRLVDVRNLVVHNRGVVNRIFKERNPKSDEAVGDRISYNHADALGELLFTIDWIMDLDFRLIQKFKVPTKPRVPRPKIPGFPDASH
jgi:hypothetical protein